MPQSSVAGWTVRVVYAAVTVPCVVVTMLVCVGVLLYEINMTNAKRRIAANKR